MGQYQSKTRDHLKCLRRSIRKWVKLWHFLEQLLLTGKKSIFFYNFSTQQFNFSPKNALQASNVFFSKIITFTIFLHLSSHHSDFVGGSKETPDCKDAGLWCCASDKDLDWTICDERVYPYCTHIVPTIPSILKAIDGEGWDRIGKV